MVYYGYIKICLNWLARFCGCYHASGLFALIHLGSCFTYFMNLGVIDWLSEFIK
jgi:hypothetical protein